MCSTASSMNGIDTNPSVMSTWLAWLRTTPENERGRGQDAGRRQFQRTQEEIHPDRDEREEDHFGGDPRHPIGQDHEEPDQGVERPRVEPGQQRGTAEDVLVPERQLARRNMEPASTWSG
jgi:hypothetical protein